MKVLNGKKTITALLLLPLIAVGCSSMKSVLGVDSSKSDQKPINNPFVYYNAAAPNAAETMILRAKKGDGTVEVEIPASKQAMADFVIPISPSMKSTSGDRMPASADAPMTAPEPGIDGGYRDREPSLSDREITRTFPQNLAEDDAKRREIEQDLGLVRSEEGTPEKKRSYLASVDHVKQLYRAGRFEAALLETDELIKEYPTNPKLYEMRGTLLDRVGQTDLALSSWKQALRFDPKNESLRRFVDRKEQKRSLASP